MPNGNNDLKGIQKEYIQTLNKIVNKIKKTNQKIILAENYLEKIENKQKVVMKIFPMRPFSYIIKGILTISALIFDYFVNIKTLVFFLHK